MDMPDRCYDCEMLYYEDGRTPICRYCAKTIYDQVREVRPDWCPLRELPEKFVMNIPHDRDYDGEYEYGWNACIDEILSLEV